GFVGLDARGVDRHHIRPVEEIGEAAKAFGLALRAIGGAGAIKAHELRVGRRIDDGLDLELERAVRRLRDGEPFRRGEKAVVRERLAVEFERTQREFVAVEDEGRWYARAVRLKREVGPDDSRGRIERYVEIDGVDQPIGRAVLLQTDGAWFFGVHDRLDVEVSQAN